MQHRKDPWQSSRNALLLCAACVVGAGVGFALLLAETPVGPLWPAAALTVALLPLAFAGARIGAARAERDRVEADVIRTQAMLDMMQLVQARLVAGADSRAVFDEVLQALLRFTGSEHGFIAEAPASTEGNAFPAACALLCSEWPDSASLLAAPPAPAAATDAERHGPLDALFARRQVIIVNDAANEPSLRGLATGEARLETFLGLPYAPESNVAGIIGLAGRPGGYDATSAAELDPLVACCAAVSAHFRAEKRRQNDEARLSIALETSHAALFDWNIATGDVFLTREWRALLGEAPEACRTTASLLAALVHPDDLPRVRATVTAVLMGSLAHYAAEQRVRTSKGAWLWIEVSGRVVARDAAGRALRAIGINRSIAERKAAEDARRVSDDTFLKAFRASPMLIAISAQDSGRYVYVNEAYEKATGYTSDDMIGRTSSEIGLCVDPTERERLLDEIRRHGRVRDFGLRLRQKSGAVMDCETSAEPLVVDGVACLVAVTQDVTARKRCEASLRESEERFRDLATLSSDWFWEQDRDFRFVLVSDDIYAQAQFSPGLSLGKTRWELPCLGVTDAQWAAHRARLERHEPFRDFMYQTHNDVGELRWFSVSGMPVFDAQGAFRGYRGTGHDITDRVHLEAQVRQVQKMEAIGQLAGGIAHDFNNILAAINGNTRLVRADLEPDHPAQTSLGHIEKSATRAQELVRRILTFSRGEGSERESLDLSLAVDSALKLLRSTLPASIEIRSRLPSGLPRVESTMIAVHQLMINLCSNASDAMSGGGVLEVETESTEVNGAAAGIVPGLSPGAYVRLTVRDNGVGMEPAVLARIFEPFYSTKGPSEGTGLGLAVVHGIVREHGGTIGVTSTAGRGSEFRVYFPAVEAIEDNGDQPPERIVRGEGECILFVDDEEALVFLSQRMLNNLGYQVHGCRRADEALIAFQRDPEAYDAVVTDLSLPGMSGLDLAERILAIRPELPVIVMSGYVRDSDAARAQEIGVGAIHWKPNTIDDLARTLHQRLSTARGVAVSRGRV